MEGEEDRRTISKKHVAGFAIPWVPLILILLGFPPASRAASDYRDALSKSLLYFEAQRSGRLPHDQRVAWRGNSGLTDGLEQGVDLVGGYYDAGDHVKFGLPMAFTITMLSWSMVEYGDGVAEAGELKHALEAIKWGTDYFIKAHTQPNVFWAQVGDGDTDHYCWQRPEDMTTSRQAYKIDAEHPGSEVAGETAAAMAAASMVFQVINPHYSHVLLHHAQELFAFADEHRGKYDDSIGAAVKSFYPSVSGYADELLWAALWLHRATGREEYLDYVIRNADELNGTTWAISEFSWDIKYAGLQILASKLLMEKGKDLQAEQKTVLEEYRSKAEHYLCSCLNMNGEDGSNVHRTPAGLLFVRHWNNMQYVAGAVFLLTVYSDYLAASNQRLHCPRGSLGSRDLLAFAKSQVDYILGANPAGVSYLVGHGARYPTRVHHRAASSVSYKEDKSFIGCSQGYDEWYGSRSENPNVLVGALVGGPDDTDEFSDARGNHMQTEACTYNTALMVGVFAKLSELEGRSSSSSSRKLHHTNSILSKDM
ncbi:unnamed protein product [Musa acuminata subsp. malaccensis]|uniref:Endoglucanase n=1 Tax=Musa acuminata subsp. malaccensis TaxID=214687 RepID=A0A804IP58_MUSAM|nr:PREDICTED: endoglucanase 7 [Musa acuminata subsp. malaccensis]CAG1842021.1 unnamed protein product [Musa acuminata subsp. malaccensis]